jgi:pimeloyl-ACP methyl ester carboxylesterase
MTSSGYWRVMTAATSALRPCRAGELQGWIGGEGPPVALVHGLGGSSANWVEVLPLLLPHRRLLVVDLPGHGGSPAPRPGAGIDAYADALGAALTDAACAPALVAGHSFGGQVAARLALRSPELVSGLLLVCPSGISSRRPAARLTLQVTTRVRPARKVRPFALRLADRSWFRRAVFNRWLAGNAGAVSPRAVRGLVRDAHRHVDVRTASRAMGADDVTLWLDRVRAPSLVLWGADDMQLPVADGLEFARRLRGSLRVVAGCGHLVIVERPDVVADALPAVEASR